MNAHTLFILNHYAYAPDQSAGTRQFELARQIKRQGGKPVIISCSFFHKNRQWRNGCKSKLIHKESIEGVDYVWIWGSPYSGNGLARTLNLAVFATLSFLYLLFKSRAGDVLYASSPQPFAPFLSFFFLGRRFFKVFEIRDFWPQIFIDMGVMDHKSKIAKIFFWIERYMVSKADVFVSNLSGAERYCFEKQIEYKKFYWVPNGVRKKYCVNSIQPIALQGCDENIRVLYTGAHGEAQNLQQVIAAAQLLQHQGVEFHFLGDGPEKEKMLGICEAREIENVYFYEPVSTDVVKNYIMSADVLLLPLVDAKVFSYGISPNKLPEYLASSKPIIFFGSSDASPFVNGKGAIVTNGTSAEDLVRSVMVFLNMNETDREAMAIEAQSLLESKFILDKSLRDVVCEMLRRTNGR